MNSETTSKIKTSPEKQSHFNKGKSGKCGSSFSLNTVKKNHKLSVKQTPVRSTSKTPKQIQKKPVRKSIPTSRNQEENENSSDEDYRPKDDVLNTCASQSDTYDPDYESTVDLVRNCNIYECDFSKISCVETEPGLDKPANLEFAKTIKKNCKSMKTNDNDKHKS